MSKSELIEQEWNSANAVALVFSKRGDFPNALQFHQAAFSFARDLLERSRAGKCPAAIPCEGMLHTSCYHLGTLFAEIGQLAESEKWFHRGLSKTTDDSIPDGSDTTFSCGEDTVELMPCYGRKWIATTINKALGSALSSGRKTESPQ